MIYLVATIIITAFLLVTLVDAVRTVDRWNEKQKEFDDEFKK